MNTRTSTQGSPEPTSKGSAARAIAIGALGAFGLRAVLKRRSAALHSGVTALHDTVSPPETDAVPPRETTAEPGLLRQAAGPAHAPGHRHLEPDRQRTTPRLAHRAWRRWAPRADHTGHPPRV
jgi:hypothetical protein